MQGSSLATTAIAALLLGGGAIAALRGTTGAVAPVAAAAADGPSTAPAQPTTTGPVVAEVAFPDGTHRPVLNGVSEGVELQWPGDTPYSPVVDTVRDGDTEWFRHGDGSWSTTLRRLDTVSGQYVTICPVFQPGPTKPQQLRGR